MIPTDHTQMQKFTTLHRGVAFGRFDTVLSTPSLGAASQSSHLALRSRGIILQLQKCNMRTWRCGHSKKCAITSQNLEPHRRLIVVVGG